MAKKMQVNIYYKSNVDDALKIINLKKRNKFKLINKACESLPGKKLIQEARKII